MEVQKFIKEHGWEELTAQLAIKVEWYEPGVVVLNYNQIDSPKSHPVVMECRSLILDTNANVISRAFDRFFNYGEVPELTKSFDFSSAFVIEKADGSLIKIYWCGPTGRWEISTRSAPFGDSVHGSGKTFRNCVLNALGFDEDIFQKFCNQGILDKDNTYIFEYIGPENRHVTRYMKSELVLTGIRRNKPPYTEWFDETICFEFLASVRNAPITTNAFRVPTIYDISTADAAIEAAKQLGNLEEGFVVYHPQSGLRTKIKSPAYVAVHHLRDNGVLSPKRVAELVVINEVDEYLTYYPEDTEAFMPMVQKKDRLLADLTSTYETTKNIETQKDFALAIKHLKISGILFAARAKKVDPVQLFNEQDTNRKVKLLLEYE